MTSAIEAKVYEPVLPNGEASDENLTAGSGALCATGKTHCSSPIAENACQRSS